MAFQKGISGNVTGRPKGIIDRRQRIAKAFEGEGEKVAKVVLAAAKGGDMQACQIVMTRLCPPVKPRGERVRFSLDAAQPLAQQAAAVVQAAANGDLSPDEAQTVLSCLSTYAALVQADQVEARLAALEKARGTHAPRGGIVLMELQ